VIACDEQLEGRVQRALQCHPNLTNGRLTSETNDGRVTLRGVVTTYYQKQIAQELMRSIEGVREVVNHLEVTWKQPRHRSAASA
jgi:osmotically-inducible protein OsmY